MRILYFVIFLSLFFPSQSMADEASNWLKKEIETLVSLRVNKLINKMNLVKREEFEVLKKIVQKIAIENEKLKKTKKKSIKKKKTSKIPSKERYRKIQKNYC